jgi:hypothetical protein
MYQKNPTGVALGSSPNLSAYFRAISPRSAKLVIDKHKKVDILSVFPPRKPQTEPPCYGPKTMSLHNATYAVDEASNWRQPTK